MGEISKSGLRRGRGGNTSPSLLYKIEEIHSQESPEVFKYSILRYSILSLLRKRSKKVMDLGV